jgi:hypothetical protein
MWAVELQFSIQLLCVERRSRMNSGEINCGQTFGCLTDLIFEIRDLLDYKIDNCPRPWGEISPRWVNDVRLLAERLAAAGRPG